MKISASKNFITIDCDEIIKEIKLKYGSTPIMSSKYETVKKSVEGRRLAAQ